MSEAIVGTKVEDEEVRVERMAPAETPSAEPTTLEPTKEEEPTAVAGGGVEPGLSPVDVPFEPAPMKEEIATEAAPTNGDAQPSADAKAEGPVQQDTQEDVEMTETETESVENKEAVPSAIENNESVEKPESAAEEPKAPENTYSTRGRSTASTDGGDNWERSSAAALEDIGRKEPAPASVGASFLESLTEEERRTRTRFVPDVDGMRALRKSEVKRDLALARSSYVGGVLQKKMKSRTGSDQTDNEDGSSPPSEAESEAARSGAEFSLEVGRKTLDIPSPVFLAPPLMIDGSVHLDGQNDMIAPSIAEAVTAFDPPRPPESVGNKKKHRMLRWERRPLDMEVDIRNYHKTVQRTQQELQKAIVERQQLEAMDAHLRRHFLNHVTALSDEYNALNKELCAVQQECVKASDLLTSRTRSRGAGKGSYVMRDVVGVLKSRGAEVADHLARAMETKSQTEPGLAGIGGLGASSFKDWDRGTSVTSNPLASSWVLPGNKVESPLGLGKVTKVEGVRISEASNGLSAPMESTEGQETAEVAKSISLLEPRVTFDSKYGSGNFALGILKVVENPMAYTDAQLSTRWKAMVENALDVGSSLDMEGMVKKPVSEDESPKSESQVPEPDAAAPPMDIDDVESQSSDGVEEKSSSSGHLSKFVPFGAGLLPTMAGRGSYLAKLSVEDLELELKKSLFAGKGILGKKDHEGVTESIRSTEDDLKEYVDLKAEVQQKRNALVRQRRIRLVNERTLQGAKERSARMEGLVSEMRSDMFALKRRLDEELLELNITPEVAQEVLTAFYAAQAAVPSEEGIISPMKKRRLDHETEGDGGAIRNTSSSFSDDRTDMDMSGDDDLEEALPSRQ